MSEATREQYLYSFQMTRADTLLEAAQARRCHRGEAAGSRMTASEGILSRVELLGLFEIKTLRCDVVCMLCLA